MKVFSLFLVILLCLCCTNQRQGKAIQLSHDIESAAILSSTFDSLFQETKTLPSHQQIDILLKVASRKTFDIKVLKKQRELLYESLPFASTKEKKKLLLQSVAISQKLDQSGIIGAALEGVQLCEELEKNYSLSKEENWNIRKIKAVLLNQQGLYEKSFPILYDLLDEHRDAENLLEVVEDLCAIANLFSRLGDLEKGLELYKEAYQLAVDNKFIKQQKLCIEPIINLSCDIKLYRETINFCHKVNVDSIALLTPSTYLTLSICYLQLQKADSARFCLGKMNERLQKKDGIAFNCRMAETYISENQEDSAAVYLNRAMSIFKNREKLHLNNSLPRYFLPYCSKYASLLQKEGKQRQAGELFHLIEPLMKETISESHRLDKSIDALYLYSDFCRSMKQYKKAADLLVYRDSILKIYNDSVRFRNSRNWIIRFETQKLINENQKKHAEANYSKRIASVALTCAAVSLFIVIICCVMMYWVRKQNRKLRRQYMEAMIEQSPLPNEQEPLTPQEKLYNKAERRVKGEKLYLSSGLTLAKLATMVDSNRSSLSACINQCTGRNFNQWINDFRIEEAKKLIPSSSNLSELSERVGFTSYNSFSSNFKERVGSTPKEYLRMHKYDDSPNPDVDICI